MKETYGGHTGNDRLPVSKRRAGMSFAYNSAGMPAYFRCKSYHDLLHSGIYSVERILDFRHHTA